MHKLHCFLLLSNFFCFLQLKKTLHDFFPSNLIKLDLDLDPDPHSEKLLDTDPDLDPHKMNADPQPWFFLDIICRNFSLFFSKSNNIGPEPKCCLRKGKKRKPVPKWNNFGFVLVLNLSSLFLCSRPVIFFHLLRLLLSSTFPVLVRSVAAKQHLQNFANFAKIKSLIFAKLSQNSQTVLRS